MEIQQIKAVGVRELKDNLSAFLRDVKQGIRVLVTEHQNVIAELSQCKVHGLDDCLDPVLSLWVQQGIVTLPSRKKTKCRPSPVKLPPGSAQQFIDQDRGK